MKIGFTRLKLAHLPKTQAYFFKVDNIINILIKFHFIF